MYSLFKVSALHEAGISYVPVPQNRVDEISNQMMLNLIGQDVYLNSVDESSLLNEAFQVQGGKEFWQLIDDLMNQHVEITVDLVEEAKKQELQRYDFLRASYKEIDDMIYNSMPDVQSYTQRFYDMGKEKGFDSLKVEAFTGISDTNALYRLSNYNFDLIKNMNLDLRMEIRQRVWQGIARDQSPSQIARRIEKLPIEPVRAGNRTISPKIRAKMIAHTESVRARNQGLVMSFQQYGVEYVDWVTTPWKRRCNDCKSIQADNPYSIDKIPYGGPPLHPLCHCTIAAASEPSTTAKDPNSYPDLVTGEMVPVNPELLIAL